MKASYSVRAFRDKYARGGGPVSMAVGQLIGARIALSGIDRGWTPSGLTLCNLVGGTGTSIIYCLLVNHAALLAAVVGSIGWIVSYSLDCADGQLARANGSGTNAGASLDVLCDFLVHSSLFLALIGGIATKLEIPLDLGVGLAMVWTLPALISGFGVPFEVNHGQKISRLRSLARAIRDYNLSLFVLPILVLRFPSAALLMIVLLCALNLIVTSSMVRRLYLHSVRNEIELVDGDEP